MNRTLAAVTTADAAVLIGLDPCVPALVRHAGAPRDWFATDGTDRVLATVAGAGLWCTAAVLALGLLCAAAAGLPGAAGRLAARAGEVLLPRVVQRLLAGSAGLGVLLAPVVAGAAPVHATTRPVTTAGTLVADPLPAPSWPLDTPQHALPAPVWPAQARRGTTFSDDRVTVHSGDSLWFIAGRRLAADGRPAGRAQIAAAWPRWYAANRHVIGSDPAFITPGQVLVAPAAMDQEDQA